MDCIPTEEEFELLILALDAYCKEALSEFMAGQHLKRMEYLTNERAFVDAFAKKPDIINQAELVAKLKGVRDKVVVVAAKLVQMRDHFRKVQEDLAIEALTR